MNMFRCGEVAFPDTNEYQPQRIINVPTNAAVQSVNADVQPSCGYFTFPFDSPFSDRFIVWRAVGQSLMLEERSLVRSLANNCIQFNFSRAPVIPGTSLSLSEGVLSLVVPTLSSVHRFYTKLVYDLRDREGKPEEAAIKQLVEKSRLDSDMHDMHLLASRGHALSAAVTHRVGESRVAYALNEGSLLIIHLPGSTSDKSEETLVNEGGLLKRLLGRDSQAGVAQVCASHTVQPRLRRGPTDFSCFYTVHHDGTIKIINADNAQVAYSQHLSQFVRGMKATDRVDEVALRWFISENVEHLLVAVGVESDMHFVLLRDVERSLLRVAEVRAQRRGRLVDFGAHSWGSAEECTWRVWGVWSREGAATPSPARHGHYDLEYADVVLPGRKNGAMPPATVWKSVRSCEDEVDEEEEDEVEVAKMRQKIFHREKHSFHVLLRAVQIECAGWRVECAHDDWNALMQHVDSYLRSPEFDASYMTRDKWTRPTGTDAQTEAELKFFSRLRSSCVQIERSLRRAMGLLVISVYGTQLVGVIQQNRMTIVLEPAQSLLGALTGRAKEVLLEELQEAEEKQEDMLEEDSDSDEEREEGGRRVQRKRVERAGLAGRSLLQDKSEREKEIETRIREAVDAVVKSLWRATQLKTKEDDNMLVFMEEDFDEDMVVDDLVNDEDEDEDEEEDEEEAVEVECSPLGRHPFGGPFTAGLTGAAVLRRVHDSLQLVSQLQPLAIQHGLRVFREPLAVLRSSLRLLTVQMDLCCESEEGGFISLGGWLFLGHRLSQLRLEGGIGEGLGSAESSIDEPIFIPPRAPVLSRFLHASAKAALRCLYPLSNTQTASKLLAISHKYNTLKRLNDLCPSPTAKLQPVAFYYRAIACSGIGQPRQAVELFLEGARGMKAGQGKEALVRALQPVGGDRRRRNPDTEPTNIGDYYAQAINALSEQSHDQEVMDLSHAAMQELPSGGNLIAIIATLFKRQVAAGAWADALKTIRQTRDSSLQRQSLIDLVSRLHGAKEWETIVAFDYENMTQTVENYLMGEARGADTSLNPHPFELLFAFHMRRMSYDKAARVEYELAQQLRQAVQSADLLRRRRDALATASSLLQLLPPSARFIYFPTLVKEKQVVATLNGSELAKEWRVAAARCSLLDADGGSVPPDELTPLVEALTKAKLFDVAVDLCRHLDQPVVGVLFAAAAAAMQVDADPQPALPDWVAANKRHAAAGVMPEHWAVVRGLLSQCRSCWPASSAPLSAICSSFLAHRVPVPCWLHEQYVELDAGGYCRLLLDYDQIAPALRVLTTLYTEGARGVTSIKSRVLLPHSVTETALTLAEHSKGVEESQQLERLKKQIGIYSAAIRNFGRAAQLAA